MDDSLIPTDLFYMYLRTNRDITYDIEALFNVLVEFPLETQILREGNNLPWRNGVVIRFYPERTIPEMLMALRNPLENVDLWAIHDGSRICHTPYGAALVQRFFDDPARISGDPVSQVIVRYRDGERDTEQVAENVKGALRGDAQSAFHFRNGRVFLVRNSEPERLIVRRLVSVQDHVESLESVVIPCGGPDSQEPPDVDCREPRPV